MNRWENRDPRRHTLAEVFHEVFVAVNRVSVVKNAKCLQLASEHPLRNCGLPYVCSIKVVHAVRADDADLDLRRLGLGGIEMEVPEGNNQYA